jgi:hypothetical protein
MIRPSDFESDIGGGAQNEEGIAAAHRSIQPYFVNQTLSHLLSQLKKKPNSSGICRPAQN